MAFYNSIYNGGEIDAKLRGVPLESLQIITSGSLELTPNTFYRFGTMTTLTITLGTPLDTNTGQSTHYMFTFTSGSTATTLSMPSTIYWPDGAPTIDANTHYEVNIDYDPQASKYFGAFLAHALT